MQPNGMSAKGLEKKPSRARRDERFLAIPNNSNTHELFCRDERGKRGGWLINSCRRARAAAARAASARARQGWWMGIGRRAEPSEALGRGRGERGYGVGRVGSGRVGVGRRAPAQRAGSGI